MTQKKEKGVKQEATLLASGIESTYILSFHYADRLTNVITGDTEEFDTERRNNLLCRTNYIVKLEDKKNYDIEYDIYVVSYNRFDPEPPISLYDYLYRKCEVYKEVYGGVLFDKILFQCPDTGETYTWRHIQQQWTKDQKRLGVVTK